MFSVKNSTCDIKQPYYAAPTILNLRPRLDLGLPASFIHSWSKDGCSVIISSFIFIILSCRAPKVEKTLYIYGQFGKNLLPWHFSNCQVEVSPFRGHQIKECQKYNKNEFQYNANNTMGQCKLICLHGKSRSILIDITVI